MTDAKHDNNNIPVILGTSNSDGVTPTPIKANPTNSCLKVDNNTTGSDLSANIAKRDNNGFPVAMAVSEINGITPVLLYADPSTGALLVDST